MTICTNIPDTGIAGVLGSHLNDRVQHQLSTLPTTVTPEFVLSEC